MRPTVKRSIFTAPALSMWCTPVLALCFADKGFAFRQMTNLPNSPKITSHMQQGKFFSSCGQRGKKNQKLV